MLDAFIPSVHALLGAVTSAGMAKEPALAATSNTSERSGFELLRLRAAAFGDASFARSASQETLQKKILYGNAGPAPDLY